MYEIHTWVSSSSPNKFFFCMFLFCHVAVAAYFSNCAVQCRVSLHFKFV